MHLMPGLELQFLATPLNPTALNCFTCEMADVRLINIPTYSEPKSVDVADHPPRQSSTSSDASQDYSNMSANMSESSQTQEPQTQEASTQEPDMRVEENRLNTYKHPNWKCTFMSPANLARSGFYYVGTNDYVKCAFCHIEIGEWTVGDNADTDHRRWSPRCLFIKGFDVGNVPINPQDNVYDRPIDEDICGRYNIEILPNSLAEQGGGGVNPSEMSLAQLGIDQSTGPTYKDFNTLDSRLRSYKEWPVSMPQRPQQLAEAGFFYTGKGDQTLCFYCAGGLKDWEENDDPWEQHAKWFSKCTFVVMNKGREYIREVGNRNPPKVTPKEALTLAESCLHKINDAMETNESVFRSLNSNQAGDISSHSSNSLAPSSSQCELRESRQSSSVNTVSLKNSRESAAVTETKETDAASDKHLCKICYQDDVSVVVLPCKHMFACVKCSTSINRCAICRQPFTAMIRAYVS